MKVRMLPDLNHFRSEESGIKRVVEAYTRFLPQFGFEIVGEPATTYDLTLSHASSLRGAEIVCCHGLYWTADYGAAAWEWHVNRDVIGSVQYAREVTVPSSWVQEVFQRDMRFSPTVVPHGIYTDDWQHSKDCGGYVLWNKNRDSDVCSPEPMAILAHKFPNIPFVSTFAPKNPPTNVQLTGIVKHETMKDLVQRAAIYLSTTKETFGIGTLEAMASGVPVLGFDYGGNSDIVEHGVTGYLAKPGNYNDLAEGLIYCLENWGVLGKNSIAVAKTYTWEAACQAMGNVIRRAATPEPPTVGVVIPAYNKQATLERAVVSVLSQSRLPDRIVIVNDGSSDDTATVGKELAERFNLVTYVEQHNSGVAVARNRGANECADLKYLCCLDADDKIEPEFLETCVGALEADRSIHLAYTRLQWVKPDGSSGESNWPDEWNYDLQLQRKNQVPTCNVMRMETFQRLGGYKKKYCPTGAGSEDAELWTRFGAYGYKCELVNRKPLFTYSFLSGHTAQDGYSETDWLVNHPWAHDGKHPFASYATPRRMPSHPVRQYDQPDVSVIIPVGPGHEELVFDALDSLEAQTYRKWEAIVVLDNEGLYDTTKIQRINLKAYPYVRVVRTGHSHGAGYARNRGADAARGKFLLFLDADDWLYPEAIDEMLGMWEQEQGIVYSDYVGKAIITDEYAEQLGNRLLYRGAKDDEAVIAYNAFDFDCARAQAEPRDINRPYIWNLITSLVPRAWHYEIGGFDEDMLSWEDWDYWLRMTHAGKCFVRIRKPLVVYRFYTGKRRELSSEIGENLVKYLIEKYKDVEMAKGCGCSGRSRPGTSSTIVPQRSKSVEMNDQDYILSKYMSRNRGQHTVVGPVTGQRYGHRAGGEIFYVHVRDIETNPHLFVPVERKPEAPQVQEAPLQAPRPIVPPQAEPQSGPPQPTGPTEPPRPTIGKAAPIEEPQEPQFDLGLVAGVTPTVKAKLIEAGLDTPEKIIEYGAESLQKNINGVGAVRAAAIIADLTAKE